MSTGVAEEADDDHHTKLQRRRSRAALVTLGTAARAQDISYKISGVIVDRQGSSLSRIVPGTPFVGVYTISLAQPDEDPSPAHGTYTFGSRYGITIFIGGRRLQTDPANPLVSADVYDNFDGRDGYLVVSWNNLKVSELPINYIRIGMEDPTGTQLSDDRLPVIGDFSKWTCERCLEVSMARIHDFLIGDVTDLHVLAPGEHTGIPDPQTEVLPGPQGPPGPQGVAGPIGPAGPQGDTGDRGQGLLPSSMLMLAAGSPAPSSDRYAFVGTYYLNPAFKGHTKITIDLYRLK